MSVRYIETGGDATRGLEWFTSSVGRVSASTEQPNTGASAIHYITDAIPAVISRPGSLISSGSWTADSGTNLWDRIDEVAADDDSSYVTKTGSGTLEVGLLAVTDPLASSGHVIRFRAKQQTGSGAAEKLNVQLYQGTSLIAQTGALNLTRGSYVPFSYTLTAAEANSISDYSDLRLRFVPTQGAAEVVRVTWAELQVKDATVGGSARALISLGAIASGRSSFWAHFVSASLDFGFGILEGGFVDVVQIVRKASDGKVFLRNSSGQQLGNVSNVSLQTGQYHHIVLCWTITSTTVNEFRLFVNGNLECTASDVTIGDASPVQFEWGSKVSNSGIELYTDDHYIDDDASLTYPGEIRVTVKRPAGNNVNEFETAIGSNPTNRWENVNERPLNEANGWQTDTSGTAKIENFSLEAASEGDADLSGAEIIATEGWCWLRWEINSSGASYVYKDGVEYATSRFLGQAYLYTGNSIGAASSYPSSSAAIGLKSSPTGTNKLYECGINIAYRPLLVSPIMSPFGMIMGPM